MNLYKFHSQPETLDLYDQAFEKVPELVLEKYQHQPAELKKREKALARDPKIAYLYAARILGPFPPGEVSIAKVAYYAFWYAFDVLKKPFPGGEAAIAKSPQLAYGYAHYILKKPWPEGEAAIAKDSWSTHHYARYVLKSA